MNTNQQVLSGWMEVRTSEGKFFHFVQKQPG